MQSQRVYSCSISLYKRSKFNTSHSSTHRRSVFTDNQMKPSVVDDIINCLLDYRRVGKQIQVSESEVRQLCTASKDIFLKETTLLELQPPVKIVGDIHGQYSDLLRLFEYYGYPPQVNYLFLGNYVDYGRQSLETIWLLLAYKIKYPENLFLLRGNHECASTNRINGFYDECKRRFNVRLWKTFNDCFNCLPIAALLGDKILCMHGGLSPELHSLDQIRHIQRPMDVPDSGLLCDLLWSDPDGGRSGWVMNDYRGISFTFGPDKVKEFLDKHDLDLICRGHQVVEDGYEFFAQRRLVIIFSAPNYRGEYDNAGAIMSVDESLVCSFDIFKPRNQLRRVKIIDNTTTNKFEGIEPMAKPFERMNISDIGSSNVTSKSESSTGVNPSKSSTSTSKFRSNSPGFKVGETSRTESESKPTINPSKFDPSTLYRSKSPGVKATKRNTKPSNGSSNPTATTKSENSPGVTASTSKAASKNTSVSPGYMPAERMSNTNIGSKTVTFNPESSQEGTSRPFKIDPATLYRSKSPGVKRFLGARV